MKNLNNKGMALIITLILSLVSLGLLAALFFLTTSGTRISGINLRYATSLEAAKGASDFIIDKILDESLTCNSGSYNCTTNSTIDMGAFSTISGYSINAKILNKKQVATDIYLYSIQVDSTKSNSDEKSTIQFVLRVE
jgi:Tfp pilus assembly protein PilX